MNSVPMSELVKNSDINAIHTISMNILRIIIIIDFVFLQICNLSMNLQILKWVKGVGGCFS